MTEFEVLGGYPDVTVWCREQGLNPEEISRRVTVHDDGTVTLGRYQLGPDGRRLVVGDEFVLHPVTIRPTRPLPWPPGSAPRNPTTEGQAHVGGQ